MKVERCLLACLLIICLIYTHFIGSYAVASKDGEVEEVELVFVDDDGNNNNDDDGIERKGKKGKTALVIPLVDKNFEMFTQAGSQHSSNTWVILFYSMKCKPCEYMKSIFEASSSVLPGVVIVCLPFSFSFSLFVDDNCFCIFLVKSSQVENGRCE